MGKKVNKKSARSTQKDKRIPAFSPKTVSQDIIPSIDTVINGVSLTKETKTCPHIEKGINFENFSLKMASLESHKCEDCREGITDRRTKKGKKNKGNGSKSDSNSNSIWVCLECGHFSCGGIGFPTTPQTHAARHSKQNRHPLVIKFANPNLRWCFICNTLIPSQNGEQKDSLSEFVKALKTQSLETRKDVDDSDTTGVNSVNTLENGGVGYMVRGLVNLGNTCFFNSVLQNLLAMDKLRDYFLRLEGTIGPLMVSLKKLFIETSQVTGGKNVINPRAFFGCVCVKAPQFRGFQQHDSHELLRCLLDGLCTEESRVHKRSQNGNVNVNVNVNVNAFTFVDTIFGGKISSTVSCLECGYNSVVYEPYLDLSLPLPTKRSISKKVQPISRSKKPKVPPKKQGKFRSKSKKEKDTKVDNNIIKISVSDVNESSGSIKSMADSIVSEETSWLDYLEPTPESCNEDTSGIQDSGVSNAVSWKDESQLKVQESEMSSTTESHNEDLSGIQDSGVSNEVSWKDEPKLKVQESEVTSTTESRNENLSGIQDSGNNNEVSWKDEPQFRVQESEFTSTTESQNPDPSGIQDSRHSNGVSRKDEPLVKVQESDVTSTTESQIPDPSGIQDSGNSNGVSWKDETQIKIQDSEVTSTTESYTEDPSVIQDSGNSNKVSTSGGNEITEKPLEFDGFGIGVLFDEPEEVDVIPLSNGDEKKGLMTTSNSESDPDDIDDNNSPVSVEKCLAYFTTPELLTKTEHAWQCEQCSKHQRTRLKNTNKGKNGISSGSCDSGVEHLLPNGECNKNESDSSEDDDVDSKVARDASKRILISRAPPVLTIHLKRFCQDARGRLSKLNGHVSFKDTIDLKPYMDPSWCKDKETYKYKLMGVVEHLGSMRGGHYVAYVKGGDCIWYHASDAYIRVASLEEVLRCEAYILFYEAM